jgi:hypothetical protein
MPTKEERESASAVAGDGGHRGWLHEKGAGRKGAACMADGTYLMSTPRVVPRKNGLLSMTAPEERPHPRPAVRFLRSDPPVVIR